ncbi:hypothetical protein E8E14_012058 [Neopestalotiopsis sp. 37M]|nr:hypothetical protein E8E14_012058 [Neopestalotiopsis sp. 37M]
MGVAHIWIDAFCIVQDDEDDKIRELALMPDIYSGALVTIIAADSDACTKGFLNTSPAAPMFHMTVETDSGEQGPLFLEPVRLMPPIDARAWTYQEGILSPRVLYFNSRLSVWDCAEQTIASSGKIGLQSDDGILAERHFLRTDHTERRIWWNSVGTYSRRKLTFMADKPNAFAGIAEQFARGFYDEKRMPGEYLAGHWTSDLSISLGWGVEGYPRRPKPAELQAPSWSWMSIDGEINGVTCALRSTQSSIQILEAHTELTHPSLPCLITIITCTWTVLHLNVAAFEDTSWQRFWRKAKWMAITILLPEVIFAKAICELRLALKDLHELDKTLSIMYQDGLEWKVWGPDLTKEISWSWKVKDYSYGLRLLYLLMGLPQPVDKAGNGVERVWSWKEHKPIVWLYELGKLYSRSKLSQPSDERAGRMTVHGLRNGSNVMGSDRSSKPTLKLPDESDRSGRRKIRSAEHKEISVGDDDSVEARQASADRQPPAASTETVEGKICQEWTITHSYLANMGGLIRLVPLSGNKFSYRVITGAELSRRFLWDRGMLPLVGLALSEDDIADKSKADWLLRSLSVLQISWLILSVISRGVSSLPLTQFEIATLAFSVFAIATFLANWWKPKDISWPVRLQEIADGRFKMDGSVAGKAPERHRFDKRQPFLRRLWSPRDTTITRHRKDYRTRVRNDIVDMEGNVPLMFALMAVSSLVFGGIHCSAWNFTFPSRTELILWRVVSIASAVIPVIAIIFNVLLTYFATAYTDKRLWSILRIGLSSLCPSEYLEALRKPDFVEWGKNEQRILFSQPAGHRNFAEKPATPDVPPGINWQDPLGFGRMRRFSNNLQCFLEDWDKTGNGVKRI